MRVDWRVELPQLTILAMMFALVGMAWPVVPFRTALTLLFLPLLAVGVYAYLHFVRHIDPHGHYDSAFGGPTPAVRGGLLFMLAALHALRIFRLLGS